MWLSRMLGRDTSKSTAAPPPPAEVPAPVQGEAGDTPPATESRVDTSAIVQRTPVASKGPTYGGKPIPFYPNRGLAVPVAAPDSLLQTQAELISRLHQASGFSYADFNQFLKPVLANYAQFVHLLPASENHHHWDIGGLLRHGLECAYFAARKCEGSVFALDFTPTQRKALEPRYRMCAILGALMHDLGKPLFDVGAVDESGELLWDPHVMPLHAWLVENKLPHYFITWRHGNRGMKHEAFTTAAIYRIVPEDTLRWIGAAGSQKPFSEMLLAMTSRRDASNPLVEIIKFADQTSVSRDILASRERLAETAQGGLRSLAARLVRVVHDKILSGEWRLNRLGDPVYYTDDGIVAVFPEITRRMIDGLRDGGDQSIAYEVMQILEILGDYGFTEPQTLGNGQVRHTWEARLTVEDKGKTFVHQQQVIRFVTETIIPQVTVLPTPVKVEWITPDGVEQTKAPAPVQVSAPASVVAGQAPAQPEETPIVLVSGDLPPKPSLADVPAPAQGEEQAAPAEGTAGPQAPEGTKGKRKAKPAAPADQLQTHPHLYPAEMLQKLDLPAVIGGQPDDPTLPDSPPLEESGEIMLSSGDEEAPSPADDPEHPYYRDRQSEKDYRDEQHDQAMELVRSSWPPASAEEAHLWLKGKRPLGIYLQDVAASVVAGKLRMDEHLFVIEERVNLRFPMAFEELGADVYELRTEMSEIGWLERDPATPTRQNVTITHPRTQRPVECLRLNADLSLVFSLITAVPAPASAGEQAAGVTLGPYLTVDDIGSWTAADFSATGTQEAGAVMRHAIYRFLKDRHVQEGEAPESLFDLDERLVKVSISDFIATHSKLSRSTVNTWCVDKVNPLFVITQYATSVASRWEMRVNPNYNVDLDRETAEKRRQKVIEEQNA